MADYYVDHGAYPAYAAAPTWNEAQDGDGKATGLAIPATAYISFSNAPSSGTISVCGVTVSTTGVVAAASADAAANALATNINATTGTVAAGVATGTPQLRDLLYARGPSGGAPSGTCQLMSRVGSADFNYATTAAWALATTFNNVSSSAVNHQFSGGASGVWGYLVNTSTVWPSAKTAGNYGAWLHGAGYQPHHGPATLTLESDRIFVRTRGQYITMPTNTGITNFGRSEATYVYDNGTGDVAAWNGDSSPLTITIMNTSGGYVRRQPPSTNYRVREMCKTLGRVVFIADGSGSSITAWLGYNAITYCAEGLDFKDTATSGASYSYKLIEGLTPYASYRISKCRHTFFRNVFFSPDPNLGSTNNAECVVEDTDYVWTSLSSSPGVPMTVASQPGNVRFSYISCRFTGLPSPVKLFGGTFYPTNAVALIGDSCTGCDNANTLLGITGSGYAQRAELLYMLLQNLGPKRAFRLETTRGYSDWFPDQGYPTYDSQLPDGTYWSYRTSWSNITYTSTTAGAVTPISPLIMMRSAKTVVSAGKSVVTVDLMLDGAYANAITYGHIEAVVSYVSAVDGKRKSASTYDPASSTPIQASTAQWNTGSYGTHVPRKLLCTLPDDIQLGTEVEVTVRAVRPAPSATQYVFTNPEVALS